MSREGPSAHATPRAGADREDDGRVPIGAPRRTLVLGGLVCTLALVSGVIGFFAARNVGNRDAQRVDDERTASAVAILDGAVTRSARGLESLLSLLDAPGDEPPSTFDRFARATVGDEDFTPTLQLRLPSGTEGRAVIDGAVMTGRDRSLLGTAIDDTGALRALLREPAASFDIGTSRPTTFLGRRGVWFAGPYPAAADERGRRFVAAFIDAQRLFAHQNGAHVVIDGMPLERRRPTPDHVLRRSFEAHGRQWQLVLARATRAFGSRAMPWSILVASFVLAAAGALATSRVAQNQVIARERAEQRLRVLEAAGEERGRLARDLHDSVSQALFSMTLQARTAEVGLEREGIDPDGVVARSVLQLGELTRAALAEIRALIFELRPQALDQEGFVAALRQHAAALAARERRPVEVAGPVHRIPLAPRTEEHVFRIALEAVHNAVRHADAERIDVRVTLPAADRVRVEVCDDGRGFDPDVPVPGHYGLETMRERAAQIQGDLRISSRPGAGTTVTVDVPTES